MTRKITAGFLIGWYAGSEQKGNTGLSEVGGMFVGLLIGATAGLVVGAIIGITSSEEEVIIYPHMPEGISKLKSYSLYYRNTERKKE
jgi:hypothetical protein